MRAVPSFSLEHLPSKISVHNPAPEGSQKSTCQEVSSNPEDFDYLVHVCSVTIGAKLYRSRTGPEP